MKADPKRNIVDDSFVFEIPWEWMGYEFLHVGATLSEPEGPPPSGACMSDLEQGPAVEIDSPTHIKVAFARMGYDFLPGTTITRYCSSSLQTTRMAFHAIKAGEGDQYIAAGVEAVSRASGAPDFEFHKKLDGSEGSVYNVYIPMGLTAETVAAS